MVEQTTHIRIDKKLKKSLDSLKGSKKTPYSAIISKYLPLKKDIWKDRLYQDFKVLEEDFPEKVGILEDMRMVIFNSMDLPKELSQKHDKEMELRLNELSHYGLELKKEGVNIGEHDVNIGDQDVNKNLQPKSVPSKGGIDLDKESDINIGDPVTDEDSDLAKYTYIKELSEPQPGLCDTCESDEVFWVADLTDGGIEKLCYD